MKTAPLAHPLAPEARALAAREVATVAVTLALAIAPHALRVPLWISALTALLIAWRGAATLRPGLAPARLTALAVTFAAVAAVWLEYGMLFGRVPGIALLVLFAGLKLLESRTQRDAAAAVFLAYFLVITNFLYTQTIPTALAACAAVLAATVALVGLSAPVRGLAANARTALLLFMHALPAGLVLFVLFPRVPAPAWGLPAEAFAARTGLSETMSPGSISLLAQSDALAFRAEFRDGIPPPRLRYWRGPVLTDFDGRTWHGGAVALVEPLPPPAGGTWREYAIVLEAHQRHWLFALETAATRPPASNFAADGLLLASAPVRQRLRYEMASVTDGAPRLEQDQGLLARARALPEGYDPRTRALGAEWRRTAGDEAALLARAIEFFRTGRFVYTLEPPPLARHTADEFLFGTRTGFCEHFASAFVVLMRAAGVPARVVTGYLGGDPNPVDGILTVRQSDAHAWAEVHLPGRGWVRVDPTAAAVPGRLEAGLARAVAEETALPLLLRPEFEWLRALRYNWEALAHRWNVWVLGYNPERQREFVAQLGLRAADWRELGAALALALAAFFAALSAWAMLGRERADPVQRHWARFCARLAARGVPRAPSEGPRDYTERAAAAFPAAGGAIRAIGEAYLALRYGRGANRTERREFARQVRRLRLA